MAFFDMFRKMGTTVLRTVSLGSANWMGKNPRDYAKEAYKGNVVAFRCMHIIASGVASVPLRVYVNDELNLKHPLQKLLNRPNPRAAHSKFFYKATAYKYIAGNSYIEGIGPDNKPPLELWEWTPYEFEIKAYDGARMPETYIWKGPNGITHKWDLDGDSYISEDGGNLLHWEMFDPLNKYFGMSPIEPGSKSIDQHNMSSTWNQKLLQNDCSTSGAYVADDVLTKPQQEQVKKQHESKKGFKNAGGFMILAGKGLKWLKTSMSPKEMDWIQGHREVARETAAAFGVPTQVIPIQGDQTFANYETARRALWEDTIMPEVQDLCDEFNMWLSPMYGDNVEIRPDYNSIAALDGKRKEKWEAVKGADWLTINEKRTETGFGEDTNPAADDLFISSNMLPLGFDVFDSDNSKSLKVVLKDYGMSDEEIEEKIAELEKLEGSQE